jgi:hypothetical protein
MTKKEYKKATPHKKPQPCAHCGKVHDRAERQERAHLSAFVQSALDEYNELGAEVFHLLRRRTNHPLKALVVLCSEIMAILAQADNDDQADVTARFVDQVSTLLAERLPRGLERRALDKTPAQA